MRDPLSISTDGYLTKYKRTLNIAVRGYLSEYAIIAIGSIGAAIGGLKKPPKKPLKNLSERKRKEVLKREDNEILFIIQTFMNKLKNL